MRLSSLSILIPAYNVDDTIKTVVLSMYEAGNKITNKLEIIVIDDGSTDKTNRILRTMAPKIPHLTIINHDRNLGYGKTIKELYFKGTHEWLFTFPSDNQFSASDLEKLMVATNDADMILGKRVYRQDPILRLIQSRIYNGLLRLLFHLTLTDVNTIRLMKRSIIKTIELSSQSAFIDAELAIRAKNKGFRIVEVPVSHTARKNQGATGGNVLKTILPTVVDMITQCFRQEQKF